MSSQIKDGSRRAEIMRRCRYKEDEIERLQKELDELYAEDQLLYEQEQAERPKGGEL